MSLMRRDSLNAQAAGEPALKIQRRLLTHDGEAFDARVEWHHCAGDVIGFYPKDAAEEQRALDLIDRCRARADAKKNNALCIKSKAAAWRHIAAQQKNKLGGVDAGFGFVEIKYGKYGAFVPSFGTPDEVYFFQSDEEKSIIQNWVQK